MNMNRKAGTVLDLREERKARKAGTVLDLRGNTDPRT
jgi:hypothetical protein